MGYHSHFSLHGNTKWVEIPLDGCRNKFLEWILERKCLHVSTIRICCEGTRTKHMQTRKFLIWPNKASRAWYNKITKNLLKLNYKHCNLDDTTLFVNKIGRSIMFLVVYVDDLLMPRNNENYIASIKQYLKKRFEMVDIGHIHNYLGIEFTQHIKYIFISRKKYVGELLNRFRMVE